SLDPAPRGGQPIGQALESGAERPEKTWCDRLARERLAHTQAERQCRLARPRAESLQRLERAAGGPLEGNHGDPYGGSACCRAPACPPPPTRGRGQPPG